jgi:hypothetical protein
LALTSLKTETFLRGAIAATLLVIAVVAAATAALDPTEGRAAQGSGAFCPPLPLVEGARLSAGFAGGGAPARTLPFGRRSLIVGRLTDRQGFALPGEPVCIEERVRTPGAVFGVAGTTRTRADGSWSFKLRSGPSRVLRVLYGGDPEVIGVLLNANVRAHATLHVRTGRAVGRRRLGFYGRIPGPLPAKRVVILQGRAPGGHGRRLIRRAKTDVFGRFRMSYASRGPTRRISTFWVVVPAQDGYPYVLGRSAKRFVHVR